MIFPGYELREHVEHYAWPLRSCVCLRGLPYIEILFWLPSCLDSGKSLFLSWRSLFLSSCMAMSSKWCITSRRRYSWHRLNRCATRAAGWETDGWPTGYSDLQASLRSDGTREPIVRPLTARLVRLWAGALPTCPFYSTQNLKISQHLSKNIILWIYHVIYHILIFLGFGALHVTSFDSAFLCCHLSHSFSHILLSHAFKDFHMHIISAPISPIPGGSFRITIWYWYNKSYLVVIMHTVIGTTLKHDEDARSRMSYGN